MPDPPSSPYSSSSSSSGSDLESPRAPSEQSESELHYLQNGNCKKILLSMALGLKDDKGKEIADWINDERFPKGKKKQWSPPKGLLIDEIKRRLKLKGKPEKTNHQQKLETAIQWLKENPIEDHDDAVFLKKAVSELLDSFRMVDEVKSPQVVRDQWSGIAPFLRLIHCFTDIDNIKEAFQSHFVVWTRPQLDGRNNELTMRECPWTLASDKWNDPTFNLKSRIFADLHDDFGAEIDLSYNAVKQMGPLTADKAKQKFFKLKNDLIIVKTNWDISGNGDGSRQRIEGEELDDEEMELINANDKCNFL